MQLFRLSVYNFEQSWIRVHSNACQFRRISNSSRTKRTLQTQDLDGLNIGGSKHVRGVTLHTDNTSAVSEACTSEVALNYSDAQLNSQNDSLEPSDLCSSLLSQFIVSLSDLARVAGKKQVNAILNIINNPQFRIIQCRKKVQTAGDCQKYIDEKCRTELSSEGFKEIVEEDPETGMNYTYYKKDSVSVIAKQSSLSNSGNSYFSPVTIRSGESRLYTHPMSAELGHTASTMIQRAVESSFDDLVI